MTQLESRPTTHWLDKTLDSFPIKFNLETLIVTLIILAAVFSRFFILGERVMSHDEVNHVVPSFDLFEGRGYFHDPVTHGPMQFHLVALTYFLLGDNDFTSRVPAALFSIAAVVFVLFGFRRYLGRSGALIAGLLFLISPYMLFYGRYTRNEAFIELFGVLTLWGVLRYLDKGKVSTLFLLAAVTSLQFCTKETAYIYTATLLLLVGILFLLDVTRHVWENERKRSQFVLLLVITLIGLGMALSLSVWDASVRFTAGEAPDKAAEVARYTPQVIGVIVSLALAALSGIGGLATLVQSLGWEKVRQSRSFDIMVLIFTLILPLLAPIPMKLIGWDPLDYNSVASMLKTGGTILVLSAIGLLIGLWWKPRTWLIAAAIFYALFVILYTTFFTNGRGFFTGMVGSLGYWLNQQAVNRGTQPWYYYLFVQMPMYEYLGVLGTLLAAYFGLRYNRLFNRPGIAPADPRQNETHESRSGEGKDSNSDAANGSSGEEPGVDATGLTGLEQLQNEKLPVLAVLLFWSLLSLLAYSLAGEKMPWLTVHITLPFLLAAGWGIGYLVDIVPWKQLLSTRGIVAVLLTPVLVASLVGLLGTLFGGNPPFSGKTLEQLQSTSTFLMSLLAFAGCAYGIIHLLADWKPQAILQLVMVTFFALVGVLTARTAYIANYINYDTAKEFLVYAHAARGPKDVLAQIEEISKRTTGGVDIVVAYDNDMLYPYWWYLRHYPNKKYYADKPTRDLSDAPLIVAGDSTMNRLDPIVRSNYVVMNYMRLWWPTQEYYNLTWERVWNTLKNPKMRQAVFNIWLNKDYTLYAELNAITTMNLENWQPGAGMRFFVRKDIVAQIWNYGITPGLETVQEIDPYDAGMVQIQPDVIIGGSEQYNAPRAISFAPDGSFYVADSRNHRIVHLSAEGEILTIWGTFADAAQTDAPGGTFNEPWGVAVGPDGSVYVTDTWNHRVQKFSPDGQYLLGWGTFGQAEQPDAFWGPRGIVVGADGRVFVSDTGNKRIAVFTENGEFITQFGTAGVELGQLDEPVGLAMDTEGNLYVADTWNQRIQVFARGLNDEYLAVRSWEVVNSWLGQSLDNKPFVAVSPNGHVFVTDPDGLRVLEFTSTGEFVRGWSEFNPGFEGFNIPSGITVDPSGRVWVTDASTGQIYRFTLP